MLQNVKELNSQTVSAIEQSCVGYGQVPPIIENAEYTLWDGPHRVYFSQVGEVGLVVRKQNDWEVLSWQVDQLSLHPLYVPLLIADVLLIGLTPQATRIHFSGCPCLAASAALILCSQKGAEFRISSDDSSVCNEVTGITALEPSGKREIDCAVLCAATEASLTSTLDMLIPEAQCFLIPPLVETCIAIDTYSSLHQPRILLSGWFDKDLEFYIDSLKWKELRNLLAVDKNV